VIGMLVRIGRYRRGGILVLIRGDGIERVAVCALHGLRGVEYKLAILRAKRIEISN
jgi:hypothetical protein